MENEVGADRLLQRGTEGVNQIMRQLADETHRIGEQDLPAAGQ
jgi:ribose 1,5-bisphosphokinase PhnN